MSPRFVPTAPAALVVLLLLASAPLGAAARPAAEDDAGSGGDAGDAAATATLLPGPGSYDGRMLPHDKDWFRLDAATEPTCVTLGATANNAFDLILRTDRDGADLESTRRLGIGQAAETTLFVPAGAGVLVGFEPAANPSGRTPARPGSYEFTLSRDAASSLASAGDAGTGLDAGAATPDALAAPGSCFAGALGAGDDLLDLYAFEGEAGEAAFVGFDGLAAGLALDVVAPDETVLATLTAGDIVEVLLPSAGTYHLRAALDPDAPDGVAPTATGSGTYLVGLELGPPGSQCRPTCMAA